MRRIEVAVGVIRDGNKVLAAQRLVEDLYYQKWEFPGGKLENNETPENALKRELYEELNISISSFRPLMRLDHDYVDRLVRLHVFEVLQYSGILHGKEGQSIQWLLPKECAKLDFLEANQPIVNAAILPDVIAITDIEKYGLDATLQGIEKLQKQFSSIMVQLRETKLNLLELTNCVASVRQVLNKASLLVLNGEPELAVSLECDGVHLNKHRLLNYKERSELPDFWVGASCHNEDELVQAEKIADFALYSPVLKTQSRPEKIPIGWLEFQRSANAHKLPIFSLGGMSPNEVACARAHGGQGVAFLSKAWKG